MGRLPFESIEAWSRRRREEAMTPAERQQRDANEKARLAELSRPRHEKAFPAAAGHWQPSKARNKEAVEFYIKPAQERVEPTEQELRRAVQASHPDKGGSEEQFIAAKKALDKVRRRKS